MAGRRGPGSEEALVAQCTNIPTPAKQVLHQPCHARTPTAFIGPMPHSHYRRYQNEGV
jgi:hypothetical protein